MRRTLRYIVLPLLGIATLRRLWRRQHPRRWQYLVAAGVMAVLIGFLFMNDAGVLSV